MPDGRYLHVLAASLVLVLGCTEATAPVTPAEVPGRAAPTVAIPTARATAAPVSPMATPVLAPLIGDTRAPCEIAAEARKAADLALGQGRAYKAVRAIARADRLCPSAAQASWRTRLDALQKLGREAE